MVILMEATRESPNGSYFRRINIILLIFFSFVIGSGAFSKVIIRN